MSQDAFHTPPPAGDLPESAGSVDSRIARAEQRLAMLRELAELGMALTRELTRRTLAAPEPPEQASDVEAKPAPNSRDIPGPRHDPAESFARLSRAVRLTLALEAKVDEELTALRAGEMSRHAESPSAAANDNADTPYGPYGPFGLLPRDYPSDHRNRIRDAVFDVINHEVTDIYPANDVLDALYERLTEGERYDAFVHRPLREAVEAICEDLGLHPDWSRWTDDGFPPQDPLEPHYRWQGLWAPTVDRFPNLRRW